MEKRYKAQISIETLAIIGVVVLGALIFAVYYLSTVTKSIDDISAIDTDLSGIIPDDQMGNFPDIPGNGGNGGGLGNVCGTPAALCVPGQTQTCPAGQTGGYVCSANCTWVGNCEESFLGSFVLELDSYSASTNPNINYPLGVRVKEYGGSQDIDVNVSVQKNFSFTNACKYNGTTIPGNETGLYVTHFTNPDTSYYSKNISCSENGTYVFTFKGVDENNNTGDVEFVLTVPLETPIYSFCKTKDTPGVGSVELCVNYFSAHADHKLGPSHGTLDIYVNQPEHKDVANLSPFCQTNAEGTICLSLSYS